MIRFGRPAGWAALVSLAPAALLFAQEWKTLTQLPSVDLNGMTPPQKARTLRLLRNHSCPCGCDMKVAECRVKDPGCSYSKGLSAALAEAIKQGKSENDAVAAAVASRWGHAPAPPKLLDAPVAIATEGSPVTGPASAPITLIEFSDFQCPYCVKAAGQLKALLKAYPSQVKLVFRQFPLDSHSQAATAAAAALAAHNQGKFWPMHDALFANRDRLSRSGILLLASSLNLDMKRFTADMDSPETKRLVTRDIDDGDRAGVEGTPTIFIDGQRYNGSLDLEALKPVLEAELKHRARVSEPKPSEPKPGETKAGETKPVEAKSK
jgi:protein-disulfide isomerase